MSTAIRELVDRARQQQEEHERRMATEPAYRAEQEHLAAERHEREVRERGAAERERAAMIEKGRRGKGVPEKFWPFLDAHRAGAAADLPASVVRAHQWVVRFLAGAPGWTFLFLAGPPGVGKTAEAAWFLDAPIVSTEPADLWHEQVREVVRESAGRFATAAELAKASTYAGEFWEEISDAPRLVIDDLGVEQLDGKGYSLSNLAHLLYHRHAHELRTVVTLNMTKAAFAERYATHDGGRLRDRLNESAWFVELAGPSLRKRLLLEESAP
jgi:DNA replication protein DnaC